MLPEIIEVNFKKPRPPQKPRLPALYLGRNYQFISDRINIPQLHGLIGDYIFTIDKAEVSPVKKQGEHFSGFFWDTDVKLEDSIKILSPVDESPLENYTLKGGSVQLVNATLIGPDLQDTNGETVLSITPQFTLEYRSNCFHSQLGVIRLVDATRFITLEDNTRLVLLDTHERDAAVLYIDNPQQTSPVDLITNAQDANDIKSYEYNYVVSQEIPENVNGQKVVSVTVLEQYTNYFIQQEIDHAGQQLIWTPAGVPISWGWSIRVEPRLDGSWYIARRKLMMPISSHNGLDIPVWTANNYS